MGRPMPARRVADTGTNFLLVPQQVADNAAAILNPQMEQLTGVADFFYGQDCVGGVSRDDLDNTLPALEFLIPDLQGNLTPVRSCTCRCCDRCPSRGPNGVSRTLDVQW